MNPHERHRPELIRRDPITLIAGGLTVAAGIATTVHQMEQQKAMQKKALEAQSKMNIAPPPAAQAGAGPKPLPQAATAAPGTTAASLRAQQAAAEETARNRKRLSRESTILTSATGGGGNLFGLLLGA
jgi:hypothetical protein